MLPVNRFRSDFLTIFFSTFQRLAFPILGHPKLAFITIYKNIDCLIHRQYSNWVISSKIHSHSLHSPKNCIRANLSQPHVITLSSCCTIKDFYCDIIHKTLTRWNVLQAYPKRNWSKHMAHFTQIIVWIVEKSIRWNGLKMQYSPIVYRRVKFVMASLNRISYSLAKNCLENFTICHRKISQNVIC